MYTYVLPPLNHCQVPPALKFLIFLYFFSFFSFTTSVSPNQVLEVSPLDFANFKPQNPWLSPLHGRCTRRPFPSLLLRHSVRGLPHSRYRFLTRRPSRPAHNPQSQLRGSSSALDDMSQRERRFPISARASGRSSATLASSPPPASPSCSRIFGIKTRLRF